MIVLVAPYSPLGISIAPHLGAARKIEFVLKVLARLDPELVLVNSAHNETVARSGCQRQIKVAGITVTEVLPRRWPVRRMGKLLNLFEIRSLASAVAQLGQPQLLWIYNGYAFETLFAKAFRQQKACTTIMEFEDGHFARSRGFSLKPLLDFWAWRSVRGVIDHGMCVNSTLAAQLQAEGIPTDLLPGVIPETQLAETLNRVPFCAGNATRTVGYFGGLSPEKGADVLLATIPRMQDKMQWIVTGIGPLASAFSAMAEQLPGTLQFLGAVQEKTLYEAIGQCDVIVNPHAPIEEMGNGVFPFKVIESIASGRLLISTALPALGIPGLLEGVASFDGTVDDLVLKLTDAETLYTALQPAIQRSRAIAISLYGETAVQDRIAQIVAKKHATELGAHAL